jgi:hypothetical protein
MWIKAADDYAYNLSFAYIIGVRPHSSAAKSWEVFAAFTVEAAIKFRSGAQSQTIVLLTTPSEESAQQFLDQLLAKLGAM